MTDKELEKILREPSPLSTVVESDFRTDLQSLLNKQSMENTSNTPDFILAEYLVGCLKAFDWAVSERERWYNR